MNCFLRKRELVCYANRELQTFGLRCGFYLYEIATLHSIAFRFIRNDQRSAGPCLSIFPCRNNVRICHSKTERIPVVTRKRNEVE